MAFSEEFDTDTCGDFERVHVELMAFTVHAALVDPLPGHSRPARQHARFQARNVPGSVGEV